MKHSISQHSLPVDTFKKADQILDDNRKKIEVYVNRLLWWNQRINLVSRHVSRETMREHTRHSLLLKSFDIFGEIEAVVDAGTGGGLPGVPLAIASPNTRFFLNDIVTKKMRAVKQMKRRLQLENLKTVGGSVEDLQLEEEFLLISKHAFKINELFKYTEHLSWKAIVFYKSTIIEEELEGIKTPLDISVHRLDSATDNPFYEGKGIIIIKRR